MRTIWKYPFRVDDDFEIALPVGAEIIHVAPAADSDVDAYIWALVDSDEEYRERRRFAVRGTGHEISADLRFVATWLTGRFVWHLFEVKYGSSNPPLLRHRRA